MRRASNRPWRAVKQQVIERFIACGDPHEGFARIYCDTCRAKAIRARLIRKVYEADPFVCPKCRSNNCGPMRVIALIDDPAVVRRILEHLGRWAPEPAEQRPN
ncbi:MAG: hypothetical protein EXR29_02700 [Betaproteobacteria bacterium]|nr:hypothetical protein [Betaproteobacteria bacterium]